MTSIRGIEIVESLDATKVVEDWSDCRSPSRARRRLKLGHPQRVVKVTVPTIYFLAGRYFAHPVVMQKLRLASQIDAPRMWP